MKKSKNLSYSTSTTVFLIFVAFLIFSALSAENIMDGYKLKVGQASTGHPKKADHYKDLNLVQIEEIQNKYLFAVVSHINDNTILQPITMSIYKLGSFDILVKCQSTNTDACYIKGSDLTPQDTLVIEIKCQSQCKYSFETYWSGVSLITPNAINQLTFDENDKAQIFHLDLTQQAFKELRLIVLPSSQRVIGDDVKIYGNFGFNNDPTVQKHDFSSQNLWKDGQGIFLTSDQMKNKQLSFLIVGATSTIYQMKSQLINENHKEINKGETAYDFIEKNSQKSYHITFDSQQADEYSIHLAKYSGEVQLSFFLDTQMTKVFDIRHFQYMNDFKYLAIAEDLKNQGIKQLYIKAKTPQSTNAVFVINFADEQFNGATMLIQSVYDFLPVRQKKTVYLHLQNFIGQEVKQTREVQINFIKCLGNADAKFRICDGNVQKCLSYDNLTKVQKYSKEIQPFDDSIVGLKRTYRFKLDSQDFFEVNDLQSTGLLIIQLSNLDPSNLSLIAIDYTIGDNLQDLRQGHPIESMIDKDQIKLFKFVNSDSNVKSVKIHVTPIRGELQIKGCYEDPRNPSSNLFGSIGNQVLFSNQNDLLKNKAVYVSVKGVQPGSFAITVQLDHEQSEYNSITLEESIQYTIKIAPKGAEIFKANPIFKSLKFNFRSSNQVHACVLNQQIKCNQEQKPVVSKNGQIVIDQASNKSNNIVIGNPSDTKYVQVKVIYHSTDAAHCQQRNMEQFYSQAVTTGDCFHFPLHQKIEDVLFKIDRHDIGPLKINAFVCMQAIKITDSSNVIIKGEQIKQLCSKKSLGQRSIGLIFYGDQDKSQQSMKIQIAGYYENSIKILPDGLALTTIGKSRQGKLNIYYYNSINPVNTFIVLKSFRGNFAFYAKVIEAKDKKIAQVSQSDYDFSSASTNFFKNPYLVIKPEHFEKHLCVQCGVLIAVYSSDTLGGNIQYSIEAFQNEIILKDYVSVQNHLNKDQFVCYEYQSLKPKGQCNLIVQISDHNTDCAAIYLSDNQYPSQDNYLAKEIGSKLVYTDCQIKNYFITVVALQQCPYSISISNTKNAITKAQRGVPVNLNLKKGQIKYILFKHLSPNGFKLITLQKYGNIQIYANALDTTHLQQLKDDLFVNYQQFKFVGSYTDALYFDPNQDGYCSNCYYIVVIKAIKDTQSSLLLADDQIPIQMTHKKILNDDILLQGDKTNIQFKNILAGKLPFQVFTGTIKATIQFQDQQSSSIFQKKKELQTTNGKYNWNPIKVEIECIQAPCVYSVELIDLTEQLVPSNQVSITPGAPSYLSLADGKEQCIAGYLRDSQDQIVLTVDRGLSKALQQISIQIKLNSSQITSNDYIKDQILNIMKISIKPQIITQAISFTMCFKLPEQQNILVFAEQQEDINLLPQDSQTLIQQEDTFIVYPQGPFLVDIFQCAGQTSFKHGLNQQDLQSQFSDLQTVGMPDQPHAIKITSFSPTLLRIKSSLSIIRWLPIDQIAERGLGYFKYKTGDLKYQTQQNDINIVWDSIRKFKQTNTTVKSISYKLFISDNIDNLKSASSCEKFLPQDVIVMNLDIDPSQILDSSLSYKISKNIIGKKFKGRTSDIYMNLVADMTLKVPHVDSLDQSMQKSSSLTSSSTSSSSSQQPQQQYYRFLYHVQQIPKDVFIGHQENITNNLIVLIFVSAGIFLLIVIILYIIIRKLVPIISRLKSRMLIQDPQQNQKDDDINIDPVIQSNERIVVDDTS